MYVWKQGDEKRKENNTLLFPSICKDKENQKKNKCF